MKPAVRIIIPTYNRADLIKDAINGVLQQTFQNFELIVVDDGSDDNTSEVVLKFAESDSRIKYLYQQNRGVAAARNHGITLDNPPKYIAFLDSDDTWMPHHLDEAISFLDICPELSLVFGRVDIVDNYGQYTKEGAPQKHNEKLDAILSTAKKLHIPHSYILNTTVCRRALVRGELSPRISTVVVRTNMVSESLWFDQELIVMEDIDFFVRMSNIPFGFLNKTCGTYRQIGDNLTGLRDLKSEKMLKRQLSVLAFEQKELKLTIEAEDQLIIRKGIADTAYLVAQCMSEQKEKKIVILRMYVKSLKSRFSFVTLKSLIGVFFPESLKKIRNK